MDTLDRNGFEHGLSTGWASFPNPQAWADLGLTCQRARAWWIAGITATAAKAYLAAGMTLAEVRRWRASSDPWFASSATIIAWHRTGLGFDPGQVWRDLQIGPAVALRFHDAGWDVADPVIRTWLRHVSDEDDLILWLRAKASPVVVMLAHGAGLTPTELRGMDVEDPDVVATLSVMAALNAGVDGVAA